MKPNVYVPPFLLRKMKEEQTAKNEDDKDSEKFQREKWD